MSEQQLTKMTVHELRALAAQRGLPGRSEMKKAELIDAMQEQSLQQQIDALKERVAQLEFQLSFQRGAVVPDEPQAEETAYKKPGDSSQPAQADPGASQGGGDADSSATGAGPNGGGEPSTSPTTGGAEGVGAGPNGGGE